jgi:hypothetical protein
LAVEVVQLSDGFILSAIAAADDFQPASCELLKRAGRGGHMQPREIERIAATAVVACDDFSDRPDDVGALQTLMNTLTILCGSTIADAMENQPALVRGFLHQALHPCRYRTTSPSRGKQFGRRPTTARRVEGRHPRSPSCRRRSAAALAGASRVSLGGSAALGKGRPRRPRSRGHRTTERKADDVGNWSRAPRSEALASISSRVSTS